MPDNLNQEVMLSVECDKLLDNFSIRIPLSLKNFLINLRLLRK